MAKKKRFQRIRNLASRGKEYGRDVVNAEQIENEWGNIKDMADTVFKVKKGEGREETFNNAVNRLNLKEEDLASAYKFHVSRLYIFLGAMAVGLFFILSFLLQGNWFGSISCLAFFIAMTALAFQSSFRAFQISKRELVGVHYWWQHPKNWVPQSLKLPRQKSTSKSNLPAKRSSKSRPPKA